MKSILKNSNGNAVSTGGKLLGITEGYVKPSGTLEITENGTQDVTNYASVNVNVAGKIEVEPVIDIAVNENGTLTWSAINVSVFNNFSPNVNYVVDVNGIELTTTETTLEINDYLVNGENTITIKALVTLTINGETQTIEYEKIVKVTLLSETLPSARYNMSAVLIGTNAYIFGGTGDSGKLKEIVKFDSVSETITTLDVTLPSAVAQTGAVLIGTNAYIFGGYSTYSQNTIVKFDTVSETITTLDATLLSDNSQASATISIGNNAYIFGGVPIRNTIVKFDSVSETITTLDVTLPSARYNLSAVSIGTNAYIFGGFDGISRLKEIVKFDSVSETITTLEVTLPTSRYSTSAVSIETNAYIFGGTGDSGNLNEIVKFDTVSETITTLEVTLPSARYNMSAVLIGTNAYIFGGIGDSGKLNEIVKVSNL